MMITFDQDSSLKKFEKFEIPVEYSKDHAMKEGHILKKTVPA